MSCFTSRDGRFGVGSWIMLTEAFAGRLDGFTARYNDVLTLGTQVEV